MPIGVRLDAETERLLDRLTAGGQSRSVIIREAIRRLVATEPHRPAGKSFAG